MTYDYHGPWNNLTGFNSPLSSRLSNPIFNPTLSMNWTVQYYRSRGLPLEKMAVGVTPVGRVFKLLNATLTYVGAPVDKSPQSLPATSTSWRADEPTLRYLHFLFYYIMCRVLESSQVTKTFDDEQKVPYAYIGNEWYGYDDPESVGFKVDWMLKQGVAGAMFWSLDLDDFTGKACNIGPYPVLKAWVSP
ncbi:chitinase-3-like protein 2 [Pomacea canaliculata]|uniref:chitinase-3-like protein 2 n=1 Tax=Pomacea canaliculata TaxID=400727 RepID=UPI000D739F16|nr:chitinase-3-like protein 2 [Pomacea canaliculata]